MRIALCLLAAALTLGAQTAPRRRTSPAKPVVPPGTTAPPVKQILVEGNKWLTSGEVIRMSGLKTGDPATKETFEAMRDRLLATGCIETVGWHYAPLADQSGFSASIQISEPDQLLPWTLQRLPLKDEEFGALASKELPCFKEKLPTYESYLNRASALLHRMLAERGFKDEVIAKVGLTDRNVVAVIFQPKTPPPNIADIKFTGNQVITTPYLRKPMAEVAIGVPYSEDVFRQFLDNQVKPMYESIGHLRVSFPRITVEPSREVKGVVVNVEVNEGPAYKLADVVVSGAPLPDEEVQKLGAFKRGQTANYSDIGLAMQRIFERLKGNGYIRCSYKAQRRLDEENKTVVLYIHVDPGPQFRMGQLSIKGLDVIAEPAIRKLWVVQPGDPFRDDYPDFFLAEVKHRGILDFLGETKAEKKINEDKQTVDVTLIFKGGPQPLDSRPDPDRRRPKQ
jgi:outer membrane protein assembly factor BamA